MAWPEYAAAGEGVFVKEPGSLRDYLETAYQELDTTVEALRMSRTGLAPEVCRAARVVANAVRRGGKLLLFGNGGSATDAQHFAAELIGRLSSRRPERCALPAVALTADSAVLTAVGNDYGFDAIFERQIEGVAAPPDVAMAISTSGRSPNVVRGAIAAKKRGCQVIGLTVEKGEPLVGHVDICLAAPALDARYVQTVHLYVGHTLCLLVEMMLHADAAASR